MNLHDDDDADGVVDVDVIEWQRYCWDWESCWLWAVPSSSL
jgi:hypothetical protein